MSGDGGLQRPDHWLIYNCIEAVSSGGNVATVSPRLTVLSGFRGRLGPKKAVLGHKMRSFWRAPPDFVAPPRVATGEFLAQNLDLARAPPRL